MWMLLLQLKTNEGKQPKPFLVIDPLDFNSDGNIKLLKPSYITQNIHIQ